MRAHRPLRLLHLHPGEVRARRELLLRHGPWLKERGVELVLADDWIDPSEPELYADTIELPPAEHTSAARDRLLEYVQTHAVDGLLAQTEAALPLGALLVEALQVPGVGAEAALCCVDKYRTRCRLAANDVPQPRFMRAADARTVHAFADDHGYPIVLKAMASTMARLVTRIDGPQEIEPAVDRMRAELPRSRDIARLQGFVRAAGLDSADDPMREFLVEGWAPGDPVESDGIVTAGKPQAFGVIEQVLAPQGMYFAGYLLSADRPDHEIDAIQATAERAAQALQLDRTGFSIEMRAVAGDAKVIEVNGRLGEDAGLYRLFECAIEADPFRVAVELALGTEPRFHARRSPRHAVAYQCHFGDGVVTSVPTPAQIAALNLEAGLCVRPGDVMHAPPHPETFPHVAWALASHPTSSRAAFQAASAAVGRLRFGFTP